LGRVLLEQWPQFAAYSVSFAVIGIIWVNHHSVFGQFIRVNRPLLFLNILLLLFVVLVPFSTGLLARYIQSGSDSNIAAAFYSGVFFCMSVGFALIWGYALRTPGILRYPFQGAAARASLLNFSVGLAVYAVTIGVAFINALLCLAIHALIAIYYLFDHATRQLPEAA
jgi:uncharacterized membrane protein